MLASPLVTYGIPLLALAVVFGFAALIHRYARPERRRAYALAFLSVMGAWLVVSGAAAATGFFAATETIPPRPLLFMLPTFGLAVALALSRVGRELSTRAPLAALVGIHAFRLPLELVMHQAAREGTMPPQMTFTGVNFDVVSGATAILVAALVSTGRAPRWLVVAWAALGTALLAAIGAIAIASLPSFHAFGSEPERLNTWVTRFPFVWLPAGLVSSAVFGHVVLWRRLARGSELRVRASAVPEPL
ncbi:MAG: hypothetical protein U0414_06695 [Polyangiaceae bacterium]